MRRPDRHARSHNNPGTHWHDPPCRCACNGAAYGLSVLSPAADHPAPPRLLPSLVPPLAADEAFARSNSLSPRASLNDAPNLNAASKGVNSVFALQSAYNARWGGEVGRRASGSSQQLTSTSHLLPAFSYPAYPSLTPDGTQPPQLRQLYFSPAGQGGSNQQAPPTRPVAASAAAVVAPPAAAAGSSPSQERVSRVLHGMNSAEFYDFVRQL